MAVESVSAGGVLRRYFPSVTTPVSGSLARRWLPFWVAAVYARGSVCFVTWIRGGWKASYPREDLRGGWKARRKGCASGRFSWVQSTPLRAKQAHPLMVLKCTIACAPSSTVPFLEASHHGDVNLAAGKSIRFILGSVGRAGVTQSRNEGSDPTSSRGLHIEGHNAKPLGRPRGPTVARLFEVWPGQPLGGNALTDRPVLGLGFCCYVGASGVQRRALGDFLCIAQSNGSATLNEPWNKPSTCGSAVLKKRRVGGVLQQLWFPTRLLCRYRCTLYGCAIQRARS